MRPEAIAAAALNGLTPDEVSRILASLKRTVHHFIDPTAQVHPTARVWHYAVVLQDVVLEEGVQIGSHCEIGRGTRIGKRSRIGKGVFLPPNSVIGEDVFVGPTASFADDRFPFVRKPEDGPYTAQPPRVGDRAVIGLGAVVLPNVQIGEDAVVCAGAVVTKDVPPRQMVRGEPSRIRHEMSPEARDWMAMLVEAKLRENPVT